MSPYHGSVVVHWIDQEQSCCLVTNGGEAGRQCAEHHAHAVSANLFAHRILAPFLGVSRSNDQSSLTRPDAITGRQRSISLAIN